MEVPTDEHYIKEAKVLMKKIQKRIDALVREHEELSRTVQAIINGSKMLVKLCPFCGHGLNPFKDKSSIHYLRSSRTFKCSRCGKTFSVIIRREGTHPK